MTVFDGLLPQAVALLQVLMIDLVLAGDNAIVVGMAVAGLAPAQKKKAILIGIGAATVLRIGFALVTLKLLAIVGLVFAGGVLLIWVCWKMFRELRPDRRTREARAAAEAAGGAAGEAKPAKSMRSAMVQIVLADVSMSLDNVLAVAGASREHPGVLVIGLTISVVLMGAAAALVARLLERYRWIAWVGLSIVLYVALKLLWDGGHEIVAKMPAIG